ncbi:MAG: uridine kinase [Pseudohongiella sp.]|uniref:amino acid kinase family protein n=1 Tax=Pseudohongiella sp. TaxID=1979412 RepID=UPI0034A08051
MKDSDKQNDSEKKTDSNKHQHHMHSLLARESLLDKNVMASTETPVVRMLPNAHVVKIGGRSIIEAGKDIVLPVIDRLGKELQKHKLILGVGCGARSRHVFSVGLDLGLPTGVLAELSTADALGNAHILGTLLASHGVVAIPPAMFGHLLPLFINSVPGVIFNGVPPFSLWEHPPAIGRIPAHRTDTGCVMLAECFGCQSAILVKDVKGLYTDDPKLNPDAEFIARISVAELRALNLKTLPFDEVLLDVLETARLVKQFQLVDGRDPDNISRALRGEHAGTIVYVD